MAKADERQEGGTHYRTDFWQTWNLIVPMGWTAFQFEIINYIDRYKRKNGLEDLRKARHWLDKLIEIEEEAEHAKRNEAQIELFKDAEKMDNDKVENFNGTAPLTYTLTSDGRAIISEPTTCKHSRLLTQFCVQCCRDPTDAAKNTEAARPSIPPSSHGPALPIDDEHKIAGFANGRYCTCAGCQPRLVRDVKADGRPGKCPVCGVAGGRFHLTWMGCP